MSPSHAERRRIWNTNLDRIMSRPLVTVAADVSLADAAELMLGNAVGSLLVVDPAGKMIGIATDSDFAAKRAGIPFSTLRRPQVLGEWLGEEGVERVYREARQRTVGDFMSTMVHSVDEGDRVEDVLKLMLERDIKHVPVMRGERPVGMIARHDLLKLMLEESPAGSPGPSGRDS